MDFKTIREFHWITKAVIIITLFTLALILVAYIADMTGQSSISQAIFPLELILTYYLFFALFCALVIIALIFILTAAGKAWAEQVRPHLGITGVITPGDTQEIRQWVEKQTGSLSDTRSEVADLKTEIRFLTQSIEAMQKKVDNIEHILEKVSD